MRSASLWRRTMSSARRNPRSVSRKVLAGPVSTRPSFRIRRCIPPREGSDVPIPSSAGSRLRCSARRLKVTTAPSSPRLWKDRR